MPIEVPSFVKSIASKSKASKLKAHYSGDDLTTAEVLHTFFKIIPIAYAVVVIASLLTSDKPVVYMMIIAFAVTLMSRWLLYRGKIKKAIQIFILCIILIITTIATLGQGIHDISIIVFPPLIVLSGQLLTQREQIITSLMIISSILWLVIGEKNGFYHTVPPPGIVTELIVIATILVMSSLITYKTAKSLQSTLKKAEKEIDKRAQSTKELEKILKSKSRLTNAVHGRIAESLSIIREILSYQSGKENTQQFTTNLSLQIEAISLIHKRLHENDHEKYIDLNDYLRSLVFGYMDLPAWYDVEINCRQSVQLDIEQAMSIGLFLYETIANTTPISRVEIEVELEKSELRIQLIFGSKISTKKSMLSEIMIQQMNALEEVDEQNGVITLELSLARKEK